jgi:hypothetical protein
MFEVKEGIAAEIKLGNEENGKRLPDVFVTEGEAWVKGITRKELGDPDTLGRFSMTFEGQGLKAKFGRNVSEELEAYNLVRQVSNREIKIAGQDTIAPGYRVWRLVAA